jgi:hypothetical protein
MRASGNRRLAKLIRENVGAVKELCPQITRSQIRILRELTRSWRLSLRVGDLLMLGGKWYVTHSGLLRIAQRRRCRSITTELAEAVSSPRESRWVFKATVAKSATENFVGYGDADPSNVSPLVRGAEMRVAETRAVNRALRKAYGIGICSVEEIGSSVPSSVEKLPPQSTNGNGNGSGPKVRDRLCQIIRQHKLDAELVKAYALDYCGTESLKDATREQIENFVHELAQWAEKDRNALLCQLNSYLPSRKAEKEGAA